MNETATPVMQKRVNDLTVGDTIKINIVGVAILAAIPLAIYGVVAAKDRVVAFRKNRKSKFVEVKTTPKK